MDIHKIGKLARIDFKKEESQKWADEMENILKAFNKIQSVPTEGIQPLINPIELSFTRRPDEIVQNVPSEELLALAPEVAGRFYKVPRVLS